MPGHVCKAGNRTSCIIIIIILLEGPHSSDVVQKDDNKLNKHSYTSLCRNWHWL